MSDQLQVANSGGKLVKDGYYWIPVPGEWIASDLASLRMNHAFEKFIQRQYEAGFMIVAALPNANHWLFRKVDK